MAHPSRHPPSPVGSSTSEESSTNSTSTTTLTLTETVEPSTSAPAVRLVLKKPKDSKKVNWTNETVDNEHMNKRKSKCCCIYKKPHVFGESSSESEDECEHCFGHCELNKNKKHDHDNNPPPTIS